MPGEEALMALMGGGGGAPQGAPEPDQSGAPQGAAMTNPQAQEGAQAEAQTKIALALDLLEQAIQAFGSETPEGGAILGAISALVKKFGIQRDAAKQMIPAELKVLMESAGMKSPEQQGAMGGGGQPGAQPPMQQAA